MSRFFSYLRRYKDPHRSLTLLRPACRMAGVRLHRVTMHPVLPDLAWLGKRMQVALGKLFGHMCIVPKVIANRGKVVLVREFLTVPLFLMAPFLWPWRRSVWFLCHHNVGIAVHNPGHRLMLRAMYAAGFRFVVFETRDAWRPIVATADASRVMALPHPWPRLTPSGPRTALAGRPPVVGFVGNFRSEKSPVWALEQVARANAAGQFSPPVALLVGTADAAFRAHWKERATVFDTRSYADYLHALERCDVVMLAYDEVAYSYRVSGVLAEAVALGSAVVVPDVPVLRDQVSQPVPVGTCYAERTALLDALRASLDRVRQPAFANALRSHAQHRSLDRIAGLLKTMAEI